MRQAAVSQSVDPRGREARAATSSSELFGAEERRDRERLRWAVAGALVVHLLILLARLPGLMAAAPPPLERREVIRLQRYRFEPPQPPRELVREPRRVRVPVPDPTPEEPEPLRALQLERPPLDFDFDEGAIVIPEGPPQAASDGAPIPVGGEVVAPRRLVAPMPGYTEIARRAHIQGIVIVRAIIDREGRVTEARVEKGLGFGLDEASLDAVGRWRLAPATLHGRPVIVYYFLTVRFELQS